jgi:CheY-like chemotaxis protein
MNEKSSIESIRILIVDDEERLLERLVFFLGENLAALGMRCEVHTAYSGQEALALMAEQPFDLLIPENGPPKRGMGYGYGTDSGSRR